MRHADVGDPADAAGRDPPGLFPPLRQPGDLIGPVTALPGALPLIAAGSHDTASAVAAVPAQGPRFAYISSGTWSLPGWSLTPGADRGEPGGELHQRGGH